jgi:hypothetical protein
LGLSHRLVGSEGNSDTVKPEVADSSSGAHVGEMEISRAQMLEVSVTHQPPQWEWEVTFNGEMIANGFKRDQAAARFEGYNAMFLLLAAGWNP